MFVKVCGLRSIDDVHAAAEAGADAVGFVVSPRSVRHLEPAQARELVAQVPGTVLSVVVMAEHTATEAARIATEVGADVLQLHGSYTAADFAATGRGAEGLWRATSLADDPDLTVGAHGEGVLLLDSPRAGSGRTWDIETLTSQRRPAGTWLLAGGLDPDNVGDAIRRVRPWGVDVSSGVEADRGVKDHRRIAAFVAAARAAG